MIFQSRDSGFLSGKRLVAFAACEWKAVLRQLEACRRRIFIIAQNRRLEAGDLRLVNHRLFTSLKSPASSL